jgi:hypothetical protein
MFDLTSDVHMHLIAGQNIQQQATSGDVLPTWGNRGSFKNS